MLLFISFSFKSVAFILIKDILRLGRKQMQKYVLIHARQQNTDKVLLVHKNRPAWQKGRLNLVGGKVEKNETEVSAAMRELKEETGLQCLLPSFCGAIATNDSVVYCYAVNVLDKTLQPRVEETEKVEWFEISKALADVRLLPNLKVVIPLLHMDVSGWICTEDKASENDYQVTISFDVKK